MFLKSSASNLKVNNTVGPNAMIGQLMHVMSTGVSWFSPSLPLRVAIQIPWTVT
jgi:hypothetical protein